MKQKRVDCEIGWVSNQIDERNYYEKEREGRAIRGEVGNFVLAQGCLKSDVALSKRPRLPNRFSFICSASLMSLSGIYTS